MHAAPADLLLIYCVRLPSLAALHSCSQHYIEYLVQLINFKKIDPLSVFEGSELIAQLRRSAIDIPERLENESDAEFYGRCAQVKKNKFPCIIAITVGLKNWESRCVERGHFVSNHYIVCGYIRSWLYSSNACHYELYF
jgi:E3 ubiquitin-protein ligase RNF31